MREYYSSSNSTVSVSKVATDENPFASFFSKWKGVFIVSCFSCQLGDRPLTNSPVSPVESLCAAAEDEKLFEMVLGAQKRKKKVCCGFLDGAKNQGCQGKGNQCQGVDDAGTLVG